MFFEKKILTHPVLSFAIYCLELSHMATAGCMVACLVMHLAQSVGSLDDCLFSIRSSSSLLFCDFLN